MKYFKSVIYKTVPQLAAYKAISKSFKKELKISESSLLLCGKNT